MHQPIVTTFQTNYPNCCHFHRTGGNLKIACGSETALTVNPPQPIVETLEGPQGEIIVEAGSEEILQEFKESMQREAERRAHWPADNREKMVALARLFPTMRGVPGTDPWDVTLLIKWMNGPAPTSGSWNAAMFLLGVWNPKTNWKECGLKLRKGVQGKFDFFRAMSVWDAHHEAAFMEWVKYPFWP